MTNTIITSAQEGIQTGSIMINIMMGLATFIGTTAVPWLILKIGSWISSKSKTEQANSISFYYSYLSQIVNDCVAEAQQSTVDALKAAKEDGKLTKEEAAKIKSDVIAKVKTIANKKAIDIIGEDGNNVDNVISTIIESIIKTSKPE